MAEVSEKTKAAMDLVAVMAIEEIAAYRGVSTDEVLTEFLCSPQAAMLYDDSLKLWWDGPAAVIPPEMLGIRY